MSNIGMRKVSLRTLATAKVALSSLRPGNVKSQCGAKIYGMVHVPALPGAPRNSIGIDDIISKAASESLIYRHHGLDGVIVENMHDIPYLASVGWETVAYMTAICREVKRCVRDVKWENDVDKGEERVMECGLQILSGGHMQAMAVASATGMDFIRCECFVFGHLADEGWMDACAGPLLRYRKLLGAENVRIYTDIKKKHCSHHVTSDLTIGDVAEAAEFFLSDGIIVTGGKTGQEADVEEVRDMRNHTSLPILIGSGVTAANLTHYWPLVDAVIVGSHFKHKGVWSNEIDEDKVHHFMDKVKGLSN